MRKMGEVDVSRCQCQPFHLCQTMASAGGLKVTGVVESIQMPAALADRLVVRGALSKTPRSRANQSTAVLRDSRLPRVLGWGGLSSSGEPSAWDSRCLSRASVVQRQPFPAHGTPMSLEHRPRRPVCVGPMLVLAAMQRQVETLRILDCHRLRAARKSMENYGCRGPINR